MSSTFAAGEEERASALAACLMTSGHEPRAIAEWRRRTAWMMHRAGERWHELVLLSEVMDDFARSRGPGDPAPAFYRVTATMTGGRDPLAMAEQCYTLGLALAPDRAESLYNLATLLLRRGETGRAFAAFDAVAHMPPAADAQAHAFLNANADWRCGEILEARGELESAAARYESTLRTVGGFGPDQLRYPRLLRRLKRHEQAAAEYERAMPYSHRYAPEFVLPASAVDFPADAVPPGKPVDPLAIWPVETLPDGAKIIFCAGLYFRLQPGMSPEHADALLDLASTKGLRRLFKRIVRCAPSAEALRR